MGGGREDQDGGHICTHITDSQVVKNPPANAADLRDMGSVPRSGRTPGEGHGDPLQFSCLENPRQRSLAGSSP